MLICCIYRKIDIINDCKKSVVLKFNIAHLKQGRDALNGRKKIFSKKKAA
jgi:hypothetical protein